MGQIFDTVRAFRELEISLPIRGKAVDSKAMYWTQIFNVRSHDHSIRTHLIHVSETT